MFLLPKSFWEIRTTKKKGRGVFAKKPIAPGSIIGDYIGLVVPVEKEDDYEDDNGMYLMYYNEKASIIPDVDKPGIHILNHSCMPNCGMYTYHGHTFYFALRKILKDEELTVSYQLAPIEDDCTPCIHACYCQTPLCTGTMHMSDKKYDAWRRFDDRETAKTKTAKAIIGRELPPLPSYPQTLPDYNAYGMFGSSIEKPYRYEKELPTVKKLRQLIRETGRSIYVERLNATVIGVHNDVVFTKH